MKHSIRTCPQAIKGVMLYALQSPNNPTLNPFKVRVIKPYLSMTWVSPTLQTIPTNVVKITVVTAIFRSSTIIAIILSRSWLYLQSLAPYPIRIVTLSRTNNLSIEGNLSHLSHLLPIHIPNHPIRVIKGNLDFFQSLNIFQDYNLWFF